MFDELTKNYDEISTCPHEINTRITYQDTIDLWETKDIKWMQEYLPYLKEAIEELTEKQKHIVNCIMLGMNVATIAKSLGKSHSTIWISIYGLPTIDKHGNSVVYGGLLKKLKTKLEKKIKENLKKGKK